jgi:hypothetical protein
MPKGALAPGKVLPKFSVPMNGLTRLARAELADAGAAVAGAAASAVADAAAAIRARPRAVIFGRVRGMSRTS